MPLRVKENRIPASQRQSNLGPWRVILGVIRTAGRPGINALIADLDHDIKAPASECGVHYRPRQAYCIGLQGVLWQLH